MVQSNHLVLFRLEDESIALHLTVVLKVIQMVEITPIPEAPSIVIGLINFHGEIFPVTNIRNKFGLPEREIELKNKIIIVQTPKRIIGIIADEVMGVVELSNEELSNAGQVIKGNGIIEGVKKLNKEIILISNPDKFLSLEENLLVNELIKNNQEAK